MNWIVLAQTVGLLVVSNMFMTVAWYAHLKDLREQPLIIAILVSWGIALKLDYLWAALCMMGAVYFVFR